MKLRIMNKNNLSLPTNCNLRPATAKDIWQIRRLVFAAKLDPTQLRYQQFWDGVPVANKTARPAPKPGRRCGDGQAPRRSQNGLLPSRTLTRPRRRALPMVPSPARPPARPPFLASLRNALGSGTESNHPAPTRQLPVQRRHPHAQTLSYLLHNRTGLRQILDRLGAKTPDCPGEPRRTSRCRAALRGGRSIRHGAADLLAEQQGLGRSLRTFSPPL